jgi:hypothetical protein
MYQINFLRTSLRGFVNNIYFIGALECSFASENKLYYFT